MHRSQLDQHIQRPLNHGDVDRTHWILFRALAWTVRRREALRIGMCRRKKAVERKLFPRLRRRA
jgi:hypothetical protein